MLSTNPITVEREAIVPGQSVWTWCSRHMDRTEHVWTGYKLVCVECEREEEERRLAVNQV